MNMKELLRKKRQQEGGFTLIELLLVIVILGVLAAVVVLSVRGISNNSEEAACEATRTSVITAAEAHYAQHGNYPTAVDGLETAGLLNVGGGVNATGNSVSTDKWSFSYAVTGDQLNVGECGEPASAD